jgi:hypothetical protein
MSPYAQHRVSIVCCGHIPRPKARHQQSPSVPPNLPEPVEPKALLRAWSPLSLLCDSGQASHPL